MRLFNPFLLIFCLFFIAACSVTSPQMNSRLKSPAFQLKTKNERSPELTLVLTFSGGGTRAAALSYGVLDELRNTTVTIGKKKRRLLDEVDLISSVSGGSFTSAYYGLFGDRIFKDFDKRFLKKPVQSDLIKLSFLSPKAWIRLLPGLFERSDLAAEYYNQLIFRKKTFADLREDAPSIIINATDLSLGQAFAFTDYHFSWICYDLSRYPISRAVAASSAVPVLFSPITLKNHASECNYSPIIWNSKNKQDNKQKRYQQALNIRQYRDNNEKLKYLHLVDGGVADNLGIRSILDLVTNHRNNMWNVMQTYQMTKTKKLVFIVVNASGFSNSQIPINRVTPSTLDVLDTTTSIQSNNYNIETLDLLRSKFSEWKTQVQEGRCYKQRSNTCKDISFDLIEVNLQDITEQEKLALGDVPTSLELPAKTVDKLTNIGRHLLKESKSFKKLIKELK